MIKARIYHVCLADEPKDGLAYRSVDIDVGLPVLPPVGSAIKVTPDGDYLQVDHITIDATAGAAGVGVHIGEPGDDAMLWTWADMQAEGWKEELLEVSGQKL